MIGLHRARDHDHRLDEPELAGAPNRTGNDTEQRTEPEGQVAEKSNDTHSGLAVSESG